MAWVREIEWEACLLEPQRDGELEQRLRKESGRVPHVTRYFSACAWIPRALTRMGVLLLTRVHVDHHLADLAGLVVSQDNSCRYCYAEQRTLMRILGFPQERISQLEQDFRSAELDPEEKIALDFVRRVSRFNPPPSEADKETLREAGFGEMAIKELTGIVGLLILFNRVSTLPALPPERLEELPDRWYMRLLRPLIARWVRSFRRRTGPVALRDEQKSGPFSQLVLALDGLPLAGELRRVLDEMWRSAILPIRTKLLVFAVVARALGSRRSEQESVSLLLEEGLEGNAVDEILSHLASPKLDPLEGIIVPFARETVWYQAAQIQRRAREVREALSAEQFLELIGVAALANTVCRLEVAIDED